MLIPDKVNNGLYSYMKCVVYSGMWVSYCDTILCVGNGRMEHVYMNHTIIIFCLTTLCDKKMLHQIIKKKVAMEYETQPITYV